MKACFFCGEDCTGQPRGKDPQGRYYHKSCLSNARGEAPAEAPRPAVAVDDAPAPFDVLDEVFAESAPSAVPAVCPSCQKLLDHGTVICTACGYNLQTQEQLAVQKVKAPSGPKWPYIFGSISLLWGLGALALAVGSAQEESPIPPGLHISLHGGLAIWLCLGSIQMLLKRASCARTLRSWAITKIVMAATCGSIVLVAGVIANQALKNENVQRPPELANLDMTSLVIAALLFMMAGLVWPFCILSLLRRDSVQREMAQWA